MNAPPLSIPWTLSTKLDDRLVSPQQSAAGLKKTRHALRKRLAPQRTFSLGRRGRLSLDNAAIAPCLYVAERWGYDSARRLVETYRSVGLDDLVQSKDYRSGLEVAERTIRESAAETQRPPAELPGLLSDLLVDLVHNNEQVRRVAVAMSRIHAEVAKRLPDVFRAYGGRLVRIEEGGEAVVVIDEGDRQVLRVYDADLLGRQGIEHPGEAFLLQELRWSPETVVSIFFPAYQPEEAEVVDVPRGRSIAEIPRHLLTGTPAPAEAMAAAAARPAARRGGLSRAAAGDAGSTSGAGSAGERRRRERELVGSADES